MTCSGHDLKLLPPGKPVYRVKSKGYYTTCSSASASRVDPTGSSCSCPTTSSTSSASSRKGEKTCGSDVQLPARHDTQMSPGLRPGQELGAAAPVHLWKACSGHA
eukprot:360019-Chlamydomonas_euryale.AAC.3